MQELLKMAQDLGKKIAENERTVEMKTAQKAVAEDPDAKELVDRYQQHAHHLYQLEQQGKPIEVDDKRTLETLQKDISQNPKLQSLTSCQVEFVDMMRKVKEAIDEQINLESE